MQDEHSLGVSELRALLATEQPWPLAAWYATPLNREAAAGLLVDARHRPGLSQQLLSWIAGYWLKGEACMQYQTLLATQTSARERALVELIHGQLLISVKRAGAHEALARGFKLAAEYLNSRDYLVLMKRHELLAFIPVDSSPSDALLLADLLTEARVIKRLRNGRQQDLKQAQAHTDTLS